MKENMKAIAVLSEGNVRLVDDAPVPVPDEYEALLMKLIKTSIVKSPSGAEGVAADMSASFSKS